MSVPLTINSRHVHTVAGPRSQVNRHFDTHGVALWLKACGKKAILFYRDENGRKRQRTFSNIRVRHG